MSLPVGLRLAGRTVLVAGGGPVAERRVRALLIERARVLLVAPEVTEELAVRMLGHSMGETIPAAYGPLLHSELTPATVPSIARSIALALRARRASASRSGCRTVQPISRRSSPAPGSACSATETCSRRRSTSPATPRS